MSLKHVVRYQEAPLFRTNIVEEEQMAIRRAKLTVLTETCRHLACHPGLDQSVGNHACREVESGD